MPGRNFVHVSTWCMHAHHNTVFIYSIQKLDMHSMNVQIIPHNNNRSALFILETSVLCYGLTFFSGMAVILYMNYLFK